MKADVRLPPVRRAVREPGASPGRSRRCEGRRSRAEVPLATGPGRRRRREPRVRRPAARLQTRTPRGRRIRVTAFLHLRRRPRGGAARLPAASPSACTCAWRARRRRSSARRSRRSRSSPNALDALDSASIAGEFYYHVTLASFGPLCRSGRPLSGDRLERLGVQGERRLAAGRRRRGHAQGRRPRALVLGDLRARRAGRRRSRCAPARSATATACWPRTTRARRSRPAVRGCTSTAAACSPARARPASAATEARSGPRSRAPSARTRSGEAGRSRGGSRGRAGRLRLVVCDGPGRPRDALGDTRSRRTRAPRQTVPAGDSAMQALDRVADVKTRYGGRYVRGSGRPRGTRQPPRGSATSTGTSADRSAADYRLRAGDVEWWDYRSWRDPAQDPVVVGAFPEPFLHGYDGQRRPTAILFAGSARRQGALALGKILHARFVRPDGATLPKNANVLLLTRAVGDVTRFEQTARPLPQPGGGVFSSSRGSLEAGTASEDVPLPVLGSVSPAPAALLLAALAAAALLADRVVSVAAIVARFADRLPARTGRQAAALPRRRARLGARGVRADAVRLDDRLARDLERTDGSRARTARHHARGAAARALPGPAADRGRARVRGLRAAARPRPARAGGPVRAALGSGDGAGDEARADARARRGWAGRGAARARGGGDGSRVAAPDCWRRSSPARWSGPSTSPRRWSHAATDGPGRRGCRRPGWGMLDRVALVLGAAAVAVGMLWL